MNSLLILTGALSVLACRGMGCETKKINKCIDNNIILCMFLFIYHCRDGAGGCFENKLCEGNKVDKIELWMSGKSCMH